TRAPPATSAVLSGWRARLASRKVSTRMRRLLGSRERGTDAPAGKRTGGALALQVGDDAADRVEVLRQHLLVGDRDAPGILEIGHELEDARRIDDAGVEERRVIGDRRETFAEQEIVA